VICTKALATSRFTVKDSAQGMATAVFATVSPDVVDLDGDSYGPGAIRPADNIPVSPWNHASAVVGGLLPVGTASVRVVGDEAVADVRYFMDSGAGRQAFDVVRKLGASAQWSWSLDIHDTKQVTLSGGRTARQIVDVTPLEVSPVMQAAGVNTRT
jgi:hypothetical protein